MNQVIKMNLLAIAVILSQLTFAQTNGAKSFTLKEAVEYAKKNNYSLKNSNLDLESSQKKVNEILASGLPQVNATGSFMNNVQIPTQVLPNFLKPIFVQVGMPGASGLSDVIAAQFGQKYSATGSITANQLLFDGGFLMGVKASREFVNLSRINRNRNEIETEVNVSKAYYMALVMTTTLNMLDTNLRTLEKSKSDIEKYYKNGLVEKTDFDRITIQYSALQLQRDKLIDQHTLAIMILKLQMGMNVNEEITLTDNLEELYKSNIPPSVQEKPDYSKRVEYQLASQSISLNNLNKKRYQYGYAPTLSAFVTHQQNSYGSDFSAIGNKWYPGTFWGLSLNVPIFDGFRKSAQIQQADIEVRKAQNDLKNVQNLIDQQLFQSKMSLERSGQQLKIQEQNYQLALQIYSRVSLKFQNGVGSSLELTTAQNDVAVARQNYLQTMYEYFSAQIDLRKATGDIK